MFNIPSTVKASHTHKFTLHQQRVDDKCDRCHPEVYADGDEEDRGDDEEGKACAQRS